MWFHSWLLVGIRSVPQGVSWRSSGWDSVLSLPRAQVQPLVGELRSQKLYGVTKKKQLCPPVQHTLTYQLFPGKKAWRVISHACL